MNKTILVILFLACVSSGFSQLRSGLTVSGGSGCFSNMKLSSEIINKSETPFWLSKDYKFNMAVGYKFRIQPQEKRFFYDIDLHLGVKQIKYEYSNFYYQFDPSGNWEVPETEIYGMSVEDIFYYFSVNPSWNYKIVKGLYAGAGIEPTLYAINFDEFRFDTPLTARIGYDFRFIDVAVAYKVGLLNTMNTEYLSSGRFNDWQIQLFIPF